MKGKFITTQIMIVCMGNKNNSAKAVGHKDQLPESNSKVIISAMVQPDISQAESRKHAA